MNRFQPLLKFTLIIALGSLVAAFTGCESTGGGYASGGVYYGSGFYDPWYYGGYYYGGDVVVTPPPRPDRPDRPEAGPHPEHPIAKPPAPAPRPTPMPSIPSMPRVSARGGGGRR